MTTSPKLAAQHAAADRRTHTEHLLELQALRDQHQQLINQSGHHGRDRVGMWRRRTAALNYAINQLAGGNADVQSDA